MAAKKRGLGKGLNALLGSSVARAAAAPASVSVSPEAAAAEGELRSLPVERIQRGVYQPRMDMHTESLQDLADSIKAQGVVQPIVVRLVSKGQYEIIAGERRWRAAQLAGLTEIPAVVREVDDRAAMSNLLRLLELHDSVKEMVQKGQLEMGHARALLSLPLKAQPDAAHQVAHRDLTVRATERLVKQLLSHPAGADAPAATPVQSPDLLRLEQDLGDRLGARVQVKHGKGGKGQLVIQYNSLDELDGILGRIR